MVIRNDSRSYLNMYHELIWIQPDEEIREGEQHRVQSEKC
jgi:hypothetical protein